MTHHVLVPELLARGYAVWTQGTRSPNNDLSLLHEQALLDLAAGQRFLRQRDWGSVITLGHSGGGALFAFYHQQANVAPQDRVTLGPSGRPTGLDEADLPVPDGAIFMAPHVGQGALLLRLIDPSVTDENDPLSVDPAPARTGSRPIRLGGDRYTDTGIYDYARLRAGHRIPGPAIVEVPTTTVVVPAGATGTVDRLGNLIITREELTR